MSQKILDIQDVHVSFDGTSVLKGLNFSMRAGELRFLIGPNGAGKTTMLDIITGKTKPHSGRVMFDGRATGVLGQNEYHLVRMGIGRKFQTPSVFSSLTVRENMEAALGFRELALNLTRAMPASARQRLEDAIDLVGLRPRANVYAGVLSHGEKQWLEIGMLIAQEPKLLLLDEPVAGMSREERNRTGELIQQIATRRSVLVVEHDMDFVRRFATTVTVLHAGSCLCEGPMEQVQNDPRVIEVYLGKKRDARRATRRLDAEGADDA